MQDFSRLCEHWASIVNILTWVVSPFMASHDDRRFVHSTGNIRSLFGPLGPKSIAFGPQGNGLPNEPMAETDGKLVRYQEGLRAGLPRL